MCGDQCSLDEFAAGCRGDEPGICRKCSSSCDAGYYHTACGRAQAGVCTECQKCRNGKHAIECGGYSPGYCQEDIPVKSTSTQSGSGSTFPYYALAGPIIFFFGCLLFCYMRRSSVHRRRRWAMAVALRDEKLKVQGLACVRLVNRTTGAVQVRPDAPTAKHFAPPSPPLLPELFLPLDA